MEMVKGRQLVFEVDRGFGNHKKDFFESFENYYLIIIP